MSDRSTGIILLGIIAIAGLGLSGFMFISDLIPSPSSDTGTILVAVWDDLDWNTAYGTHTSAADWLVEFTNSPYNNSNYVTVRNDNTRFILSPGLYKITIKMTLQSIASSSAYLVSLLKNDNDEEYFHYHATDEGWESEHHSLCSSVYVEADGVDYFEINCFSGGDAFSVIAIENYNQLSIEYIK